MSTLFNRQPQTQFLYANGVSQVPNQQQQQQAQSQSLPPPPPPPAPSQLQQQQQQQQQQQMQQQLQQGQPAWLQSQHVHKKRVIPNHLVPHKKSNFQISAPGGSKNKGTNESHSSMLVSNDQFNVVSFGINRRNTITNGHFLDRTNTSSSAVFDSFGGDLSRFDDSINESFQHDDGSVKGVDKPRDAPPLKSVYDLDEDTFGISKPTRNQAGLINKDPKEFNNLFKRFESKDGKTAKDKKQDKSKSVVDEFENAIIVFGYPENASVQIIQYFKQFGTILENFTDLSTGNEAWSLLKDLEKEPKNISIYTGSNWIKITYDNHNSALNALQENGCIFNGNLLGVVPYHKSVIDKLEKKKVFVNEDIGNGNLSMPLKSALEQEKRASRVENQVITPPSSSAPSGANKSTFVNKLNPKEEAQYLITLGDKKDQNKSDDQKKPELGILKTLSNYIFGFHDL
ncbi:hypothetical protein KGF57_000700 [Candida theae]|uniref:RRM Nup35-type domain-containing protein n=1 Tax=Candida theae TaxID=1198502 RepID=A0AAD5BIY9_9ASCO|nr:uncharacterized protein KGF57_000700 [Candida theae]KAI5965992.1 hypothetical protein KGF57_000700 [Candida theae]